MDTADTDMPVYDSLAGFMEHLELHRSEFAPGPEALQRARCISGRLGMSGEDFDVNFPVCKTMI